MPKLNELGLKQEKIGDAQDLANLPEQIGMRKPPLQPGPYRFRLADGKALAECFETIKPEINGKEQVRIVAVMRDSAALTILQAPPVTTDRINDTFDTRISNAERNRGKDRGMASDMDYLLQATKVVSTKPTTNQGYGEALVKAAGKEFGADIEFSWYCNTKKPIRVEDEGGQAITLDGEEGREKQLGCGKRYYQKDVDRLPAEEGETAGKYPTRISCECGALLYANENLVRFRA